jgi:hypothetical protein
MANNSFVIDKSLSFRKLAVAPASPNLWEIYYDLTQNALLQWNGAAWVPFGGSGSGGSKNYFTDYLNNPGNGNFELGSTAGWTLAHTALTGVNPTSVATPGTGFDSTHGGTPAAGTLSFTTVAVGQLAGLFSGSLDSTAASTAGDMLISKPFTIDKEDQLKVISFSFSYEAISGTFNFSGTSANTFAIWVYDVTNGAWIQPAGVYSMIQGSGVGVASGTFQTTNNSTEYQLALIDINATPGAYDLYVDDFVLGPNAINFGPASIAPTIQKFLSGSGTYTPPSNPAPLYIKVRAVGGGGGGVGGAVSTLSPEPGTSGTASTFGTSLIIANGGGSPSGAADNSPGGIGGTASITPSGTVLQVAAIQGGYGSPGPLYNAASTNITTSGGNGGSSAFGGAGSGGANGQNGSQGSVNSGSGGGGGGSSGLLGQTPGGGGGSGGYAEAIIVSPLTSYSYSVGVGGPGGSSAAGGGAGGTGGDGIIIVEEYYAQSGGGIGVGGSVVAVSAYLKTPVSFLANANFIYDTVLYDTGGNYNTTTGNFKAPITGYYSVSGVFNIANAGNINLFSVIDNVQQQYLVTQSGATSDFYSFATQVYLIAGQTFSLQSANPLNPYAGGTMPWQNAFQISLISNVNSVGGSSSVPVSVIANNPTSAITSSDTVITGWTKVEDPTASFNASTGVFTAPRTGLYGIACSVIEGVTFSAVNDTFQVSIFHNVTKTNTSQNRMAANLTAAGVEIQTSIRLAAGDTVALYIAGNSAGAFFDGGAIYNFMSIWEIT